MVATKRKTTKRKPSKSVKLVTRPKTTKNKVVKAVRSTPKQLDESLKSAKYFIKYSLSDKDRQLMNQIVSRARAGRTSKKLHSKGGYYTAERKRVHNKIFKKFLSQDKSTNKPDVYVLGGVAGSGKSSTLAKFIKEKAMTINNDDIKQALSKYDPSPIKKYPLIHAAYLHEEAKDVEKQLLKQALKGRKDIILDRTLASYVKNNNLLKEIKNLGYDVTVLGTNLPPHIALIRTAARFVKKGRYVPLENLKTKGNQTNASVLKIAKQKYVKKARVYNTTRKKPKLMYKSG